MQNHFELFHLPQRFDVDADALSAAYREVQGQVHPDRYAHAGDAEKRVAMQWATRANEAFQTLKNPLKRAIYLCELNGVDLQIETNTAMPPAFLMQQMDWREEMEEASRGEDADALDALHGELREARKAAVAEIGVMLDAGKFGEVAPKVRQLMFLEKFGEEVNHALQRLE